MTHGLFLLKQQLLPPLTKPQCERLPLNFDSQQPCLQLSGQLWGGCVDDEVDVRHGTLYLVVPALQLTGMGLRHKSDVIVRFIFSNTLLFLVRTSSS